MASLLGSIWRCGFLTAVFCVPLLAAVDLHEQTELVKRATSSLSGIILFGLWFSLRPARSEASVGPVFPQSASWWRSPSPSL